MAAKKLTELSVFSRTTPDTTPDTKTAAPATEPAAALAEAKPKAKAKTQPKGKAKDKSKTSKPRTKRAAAEPAPRAKLIGEGEPPAPTVIPDTRMRGIAVGLTPAELAQVDALAAESHVNRNAIMRFAVLYLLKFAGSKVTLTVDVRQPIRRRLQMP